MLEIRFRELIDDDFVVDEISLSDVNGKLYIKGRLIPKNLEYENYELLLTDNQYRRLTTHQIFTAAWWADLSDITETSIHDLKEKLGRNAFLIGGVTGTAPSGCHIIRYPVDEEQGGTLKQRT